MIASRGTGNIEAAADGIETATGSRPATLVCDVTEPGAGTLLAAAVEERWGALDVLVTAVGGSVRKAFADLSDEDWLGNYGFNVLSAVRAIRALLPALRAANGHVVLINSGSGLNARAGWGAYAASKFALRAFGDVLRQEEPALRVTSVHPGRIDTDMQRALVAEEGNEYRPDRYLRPATVAQAVGNAIRTPADAHPTEIVLRPR